MSSTSAHASTSAKHSKEANKGVRKVNFACDSCKSKKRRCDGAQPKCRLCSTLGTPCIYPGTAPRRYLVELERQLKSTRDILTQLKSATDSERREILKNVDSDGSVKTAISTGSNDEPLADDDVVDKLAEELKETAHISRDGTDRLSLHGPSSLYYLSTPPPVQDPASSDQIVDQALDIEQHLLLEWLDNLVGEASVPAMSTEVWQYLVRMHYVWIQPMFGFVHQKGFLRDIQRPRTRQSMFSPFLLYSLCTHVVRNCDVLLLNQGGQNPLDPFLGQARLLVFREVERGSSMSAISGLLLLSAKECSIGQVSQAWVYLGMAIRMVQDLGIHLDGGPAASDFSPIELADRRHSFWSTYLWDKMISMYFGRTPMLGLSRYHPPHMDVDEEQDSELWSPVGNTLDTFPSFTPVKSWGSTNFLSTCQLATVINDVLLYDGGEPDAPHLDAIADRLLKWRADLPEALRLTASALTRPPPSHVINVNCLYHMISILLSRRRYPGTVHHGSVSSALEISSLAQLSHQYYRDRQAVLSHCYCIYTAATVFASRLRESRLRPTPNSAWLESEESILVPPLRWAVTRLEEAARVNTALRIPIKNLREKIGSLDERISSSFTSLIPSTPNAVSPRTNAPSSAPSTHSDTGAKAIPQSNDNIPFASLPQQMVSLPWTNVLGENYEPKDSLDQGQFIDPPSASNFDSGLSAHYDSTLDWQSTMSATSNDPTNVQAQDVMAGEFWAWLGGGELAAPGSGADFTYTASSNGSGNTGSRPWNGF